MTAAERLAPTGMLLGEGPIALGGDRFACVDIYAKVIVEGSLDGETCIVTRFDETVGAICETTDGSRIAAVGTHIAVPGTSHRIDLPPGAGDIRMNDGKADPAGRFVCGTMADPPRAGAATLWSFADGRARALLDNVTISNGLDWSDDGETMFYIDTPTQRIEAFDYDLDDGSISGRRTIVEIPDDDGSPDGLTLDADGGIWVALWGGSRVSRYVDGRLDHVVEVPTPYVTCPVFVGDRLDTLLITTASDPCPGDAGAGDLYVAQPGLSGRRPSRATVERVFV